MILIIEGNKIDTEECKNFDEISLEDHYKLYEEKGLNKKEIIKQIAKDRNVNKNEIYMYFLEIMLNLSRAATPFIRCGNPMIIDSFISIFKQ